jgi:hypothetical protein
VTEKHGMYMGSPYIRVPSYSDSLFLSFNHPLLKEYGHMPLWDAIHYEL